MAAHLGHAKTYIQFDLIAPYLRKSGYRVTYAQNITDIDDKIIGRAALADTHEKRYLEDMAALTSPTSTAMFGPATTFAKSSLRYNNSSVAGMPTD